MIAICRVGGIGKTTMAKEVAKIAKDDKLFDEVAMAVVSQNQDDRKIQGEIADMLDLKLEEYSSLVRAERLKNRIITSGKSVLAVGIPYGGQHNRCKILLTSRSENPCNQMKSQKIFKIKILSGEEAWNFFREVAGNCVDPPNLRPIAKEVAEECRGLPVALVIVGRALENKSEFEWSDALQQLKKSIPKNIIGLDSKVYSSIKLSYDYLKSDEAKSCFLLCCLFPEDYDIHIEYLVRYEVGQSLLTKIDNVGQARNRVHAIVKNLKRSFLLLDSEKEESVKMHDVVRDVAISIAENPGLLVQRNNEMEEWSEKETYKHSAISLVSENLERHPDGLSIHVLQNLRALHLDFCELTDVSAIGALRKLEILSFLGSDIKELPREMGNLNHLKLYMLGVSVDWEPMEGNKEGANASLAELMSLSNHLMALKFAIPNIEVLPKHILFENQMIKFQISVDIIDLKNIAYELDKEGFQCLKVLEVRENINVEYVIDATLRQTPRAAFPILESQHTTHSDILESTPLISYKLFSSTTILWPPNLEELYLNGSNSIEVLFDLEGLKGFQNLTSIEVSSYNHLIYLIPLSIAKLLVKLQSIELSHCDAIKKIVQRDEEKEATDVIMFPKVSSLNLKWLPNLLQELHLHLLPKLMHIWKKGPKRIMGFGNLRLLEVRYYNNLTNLFSPSIAKLLVMLEEIKVICCAKIEELLAIAKEE
ncbi:hypothetical protein RGQ29_003543 [Quercus rubra]|uniref:NB-ARC domain-containing protein n=1 Tax=Quercus rubra TaxID=3512 RepID=A0AAN7EDB8_QUERU|nr:hypothetical protein RGQ29_003543 [Quercus rubra]